MLSPDVKVFLPEILRESFTLKSILNQINILNHIHMLYPKVFVICMNDKSEV